MRFVRLSMLWIALAACSLGAGGDPVSVTRAFLAAVQRGDCEGAWQHFSRSTQENTQAQARQRKRNTSYPGELIPTAQELYCHSIYGGAKPRSARLIRQDETSAVVSLVFSEGSHFAIIPFLSTPYREWTSSIELVREDGRWKIERAPVETGRPGWTVSYLGEVEVSRSLEGDPRREHIQAESVSHASRDGIEAALLDPEAWPRFMPGIERVDPLSEPDESGARNWRLHFRSPDGALASTIVELRPYGRLFQSNLPWTAVQWRVEGHPNRGSTPEQPLFVGSWKLRPRFEGLWLSFSLVFQPDEWPAPFPPLFLAEAELAAAIEALEREAGSRSAD